MIAGREGAHIGSHLGNQCLGDVVTDARNSFQSLDDIAKRRECDLQPGVEFGNGGFDLLDRLQVLSDEKAMMVAQASVQRGDEFLMRTGKPRMTQSGQYSWISFAPHDRFQIRRPLRPRISEMTEVTLMLASSSVA